MLTINLTRPVKAAYIINESTEALAEEKSVPIVEPTDNPVHRESIDELEAQKAVYAQASQTLNVVVEKLNEFCNKMFTGHKEEIAHLSVEIARKILMFKVEKGDYEIESIVSKALENTPGRGELVVHLNPDDHEKCAKAQEAEPNGILSDINLTADPNIGRAECLIEGPKGIVKSLIDENLERVAEALKN